MELYGWIPPTFLRYNPNVTKRLYSMLFKKFRHLLKTFKFVRNVFKPPCGRDLQINFNTLHRKAYKKPKEYFNET